MLSFLVAALSFAPTPAPRAPAAAVRRGLPVVMYASMARKPSESEKDSFVQTEMRNAAMALHTRDQAPREGKQPAQRPVQAWQPGRSDYLQFLVDSKHVYTTLEELVEATPRFASFRNSGLERSAALATDIAWFAEQGVSTPPVAEQGRSYAVLLREMIAAEKYEEFVCHFYNFYFAHTAGGRMIGKRMADMLLDGRKLEFYQWSAGDVDKELLPGLRGKIDDMVGEWSREQKDACLAETATSFRTGGSLLQHLKGPAPAKAAPAGGNNGGGAKWAHGGMARALA